MAVQTYDVATDVYAKITQQAHSLLNLNDRFANHTTEMRPVPQRLDTLDQRLDRVAHELQLTTTGVRELNEWRLRVDHSLEAIGAKLGANQQRFDGIDRTLAEHKQRFDDIDQTLAEHNNRFDGIDQTLAEHNNRFDGIDQTLAEHKQRFDDIDQTLAEHNNRFDGIDNRLDEMHVTLKEILAKR